MMTDDERLIIAEFARRLAVAIERDDQSEARELWADVSDAVPEYINDHRGGNDDA